MLITAHDAFNYFATVYGFESVAVLGIGNDAEADIRTMREVANVVGWGNGGPPSGEDALRETANKGYGAASKGTSNISQAWILLTFLIGLVTTCKYCY